MRTFAEINHPGCKVSLIAAGQKYIVKCDQGAVEQTFKFDQVDFDNEADFRSKIDEVFVSEAVGIFGVMHALRAKLLQ